MDPIESDHPKLQAFQAAVREALVKRIALEDEKIKGTVFAKEKARN